MKSPTPLHSEKISRAEIIENWALFLPGLWNIPWAIYLINDLLPRWDIRFIKLGILIFEIITPPLMIWRVAGILTYKIYPLKNPMVDHFQRY